MNKYRVWLGFSVKDQKFSTLEIKRGEYKVFRDDKEVEKWISTKAKKSIGRIYFYTSAKYAILREDGSFIEGRIN